MNILELDLSSYSAARPKDPVNLLFIHDSIGGQLMADRGGIKGESGIFRTHTNGGGLRTLLTQNNYIVHEAACGSKIGDKTDVCQWNRTFGEHMDRILTTRHQDVLFGDNSRNKVVMFQSSFSSNLIEAEGTEPGSADSSRKTTANYKAAYRSLLKYLEQNPETLFMAVTAPPLAKPAPDRSFIRMMLGRPDPADEIGKRARDFNNWLKNIYSGWLKDYPLRNVVVFDYYDFLTFYGASNWLRYPSVMGRDSHPSAEGNAKAAIEMVPFLNRALNRLENIEAPRKYVMGRSQTTYSHSPF